MASDENYTDGLEGVFTFPMVCLPSSVFTPMVSKDAIDTATSDAATIRCRVRDTDSVRLRLSCADCIN